MVCHRHSAFAGLTWPDPPSVRFRCFFPERPNYGHDGVLLNVFLACSHSKGGYSLSTTLRLPEVTAVLVEHALSHASREEELKRARTKQKIKLLGLALQFVFPIAVLA